MPPAEIEGLGRRITAAFSMGNFHLSQRPNAPATSGWNELPEVINVSRLRGTGAEDIDVRLYITFTAAMDRARDSQRLWDAAASLFTQERRAFYPDQVSGRSLSELSNILRAYRVSQRHHDDAAAWWRIAETLNSRPQASAVHAVVYGGEGDARELLTSLQAVDFGGQPLFPLLRGDKIGPMWVRMLAYPGGAKITSMDALPVAVDTHVRKVTEYLGVTDTYGKDPEYARPLIQRAWATDVQRYGAEGPVPIANTSAALDPALWFFGKWGCTRCEQVGYRLPISDICQLCCFDELRCKAATMGSGAKPDGAPRCSARGAAGRKTRADQWRARRR